MSAGEGAPEAAAAPAVPTCYRHADRETYIRCNRCDRPICPDCMVPASVGFQCPECVREGNKGVRQPRTLAGGRLSADPGWVSRTIIAVTVAVFVLQQVSDSVTSRLGLSPLAVADGEWWRLLSVTLVHQGVLHVALNMYALFLFGPSLESVLGRERFLAVYLLSALGGSAASMFFGPLLVLGVGASGAIFGVLAGHLVVSRRLGWDASQLWVLLAINAVIGFTVSGIDWRAHAGGFVAGGAVTAIMTYAPARRRTAYQVAGVVVVTALVLAAVQLKSTQIDDLSRRCAAFRNGSLYEVCLRASGVGGVVGAVAPSARRFSPVWTTTVENPSGVIPLSVISRGGPPRGAATSSGWRARSPRE